MQILEADLTNPEHASALVSLLNNYACSPEGGGCIEGFSTFVCKPLLNIHDVYVSPDFRGQGIAGQLFADAESIAKSRGCCKLTLEVLQGNTRAQAVYTRLGFSGYELTPEMGHALFWEKKL